MDIKKQQISLYGFLFVFLVFFSFLSFYNVLDPDFGWHIKTGQLILERGIPYQDWYSYTMSNFPWVNHEWLLDIAMYKIYSSFGMHFLMIVFLSLYLLSFFVFIKPKQDFFSFFIPIVLGYLATLYFLGLRPQLLGILLIAILIRIIDEFLENSSKIIYFLPLIFLLWVNIHASFFAGLVILTIIIFLEIFKKYKIISFAKARLSQKRLSQKILKKFKFWQHFNALDFFQNIYVKESSLEKIKTLIVILVISFLATLINPYFYRIYEEIFRTTGDNFLRFNIIEWLPLFMAGFKPFIYFYMGFFAALLFLYYKKIELNKIILSIFFLVLSLTSIRYTLLFVIVSLPILINVMPIFKKEMSFSKNYNLFNKFFKWVFIIFLILILAIFIYGFYDFYSGMMGNKFYPQNALPFIRAIPLEDRIFNYYGWGGYLILNIPERKYFIDGRMPSWRLPAQADQGDKFAFGDYIKITKAENDFETLLQKYDIKYVLLAKSTKDKYEKLKDDIASQKVKDFFKKYKILSYLFGVDTSNNLYEKLKEFGWKEVYEDDTALILKK